MPVGLPSSLESEFVTTIPTREHECKVISGYANYLFTPSNNVGGPTGSSDAPKGNTVSESTWDASEIHLVVGPNWRGVRDVSPIVGLAGYSFADSDEADDSGFHIDSCTWDTEGLPPPDQALERIRLKVHLRVRGGNDCVLTKFAYQLVAVGLI